MSDSQGGKKFGGVVSEALKDQPDMNGILKALQIRKALTEDMTRHKEDFLRRYVIINRPAIDKAGGLSVEEGAHLEQMFNMLYTGHVALWLAKSLSTEEDLKANRLSEEAISRLPNWARASIDTEKMKASINTTIQQVRSELKCSNDTLHGALREWLRTNMEISDQIKRELRGKRS